MTACHAEHPPDTHIRDDRQVGWAESGICGFSSGENGRKVIQVFHIRAKICSI